MDMKASATALFLTVALLVGCGDGKAGGSSSSGGDSTPPPGTFFWGGEWWDTLEITTYLLPSGTVNHAFTADLTATGGPAPFTWSLWEGALPTGLQLDPTGRIFGTPVLAGTWSFVMGTQDAASRTDGKLMAIMIGDDFLSQGAGWQSVKTGTNETLLGVDFTDANNGWVVGMGSTIRRTTNGGIQFHDMYGHPNYPRWGQTNLPTDPTGNVTSTNVEVGQYQFTRVDAISSATAWVATRGAGMSGFVNNVGETMAQVLRTTNGATTWDRIITTTNDAIWGLQATSATDAKIATREENGVDSNVISIAASTDQWHVSFPSGQLNDIAFSGTKGVIVGNGIWTSSNGGASWTAASAPTGSYRAVVWTGTSTLVAVGDLGKILRSTNSGATWTTVASVGIDLWDVNFYGSTGWAVGLSGTILRSTDGGISWVSEYSGTSQHLYAVSAVSSTIAWVVGVGGTCLKRQ
jgi:photosystem II stability/assembly factor-like uncharacterized protein